ncbi:MAG: putative nucleotidyltransferase substrate binding domain-containing protein [Psychromonas sp.]
MPQTLIPNIHDFLSKIDPFDNLPQELQRKIACSITITYLAKGEQIRFDGEDELRYLYVIRTGSMEQRKLNGILRAKLSEEDLFGFTFLDAHKDDEEAYTATAIDSTLLYLIPHAELLKLLEEYPQFTEHFATNAKDRLHSALDVVWSDSEKGIFVKKVSEVASNKVAIVQADTPIQEVARVIIATCSPTAVVMKEGIIVGLITDRDMTKRVILAGVDILSPVSDVMTLNPITIGANDLVLKASSLMMQYNIRTLPVVENNNVLGVLTTTHLVRNHRMQAVFLIEKINFSETARDLALLTSERQAIFEALVEGKVNGDIIGHVMTMIMDAYNCRLILIAEKHLGEAPCDYAWIVAGSHARKEAHMLSEQNNAIILSDDVTEKDRLYFHKLSKWVSNALDSCGYPICKGKFVATNPKCSQPMRVWKAYYDKWVTNPEYNCLLNMSVFLETRCIYGNQQFNNDLQSHLFTVIEKSNRFLPSLIEDYTYVSPPLSIFNSSVLEKSGKQTNHLNIKKCALTLIVDLARIYGLSAGSTQTETTIRFTDAYDKKLLTEDMLKNILGAFRFITQVRLSYQLIELKEGHDLDNLIDPNVFGNFERKHLKDAFRIISELQDIAKLLFNKS